MSIVKTPTDVDTLKINYLTQEMYDAALENGEINDTELYFTPSDGSGGNTNSVELTQAEYDALTTEEKNNGTIYFITDGTPIPSSLVNLFYPVGSYYETSDTSFNPNTSWGGTWSLEAEGLVHIGAGSNYTVGDTGGSKTVTLSASIGAATGAPATLNYIAEPVNGWQSAVGRGSYTIQGASWTSNQGWSHSTPVTELNSASRDTNIMQPYIVVNRWHRVA